MQRTGKDGLVFSASDLLHFLGCRHCTHLDLRNLGEDLAKDAISASDLLLRDKGAEHEKAHLELLRQTHGTVSEIPKGLNRHQRQHLTMEAMRRGDPVIYQAALVKDQWAGDADFLLRVETETDLGKFGYEVVDTKLSHHAEPGHVVQIGLYSAMLAQAQGAFPLQSHVVLGDNRQISFQNDQFAAYIRHAQRQFEAYIQDPPSSSYPEPCQHCSSCHWQNLCSALWDEDDHLSLVAGMQTPQARKLDAAGVTTLAALAALPEATRIPGMNPDVLSRLHAQAALQDHKRQTGEDRHEILPTTTGRGFERLPAPNGNDLFFDMEGDPLQEGGLEYLFGLYYLEDNNPIFRPFWAHDPAQECDAFCQLMDYLSEHIARYPCAYIYHYNHYEPTALKKLSCRHAVAERQLDELLREERFVDLYKVVREAVRVSEPAYSIKNLETFYRGGHSSERTKSYAKDLVVTVHRGTDGRKSC